MSEASLYNEIIAEHSSGDTRILRVNSGMAYQGRVIERSANRVVISPWYMLKLADEGVSDLLGFTGPSAQFLAIECKADKRKPTPAQAMFLEMVRQHGGRAGIARSVEDARRIIRG